MTALCLAGRRWRRSHTLAPLLSLCLTRRRRGHALTLLPVLALSLLSLHLPRRRGRRSHTLAALATALGKLVALPLAWALPPSILISARARPLWPVVTATLTLARPLRPVISAALALGGPALRPATRSRGTSPL